MAAAAVHRDDQETEMSEQDLEAMTARLRAACDTDVVAPVGPLRERLTPSTTDS